MRWLWLALLGGGCEFYLGQKLNNRLNEGYPKERGMPYYDALVDRSRRYAPEATADLIALGESRRTDHGWETYQCLLSYVSGAMYQQAYLGKAELPEDKLVDSDRLFRRAKDEMEGCAHLCGRVAERADSNDPHGAISRRHLPRCQAAASELAAIEAGREQREKIASLRTDLDRMRGAAERGRWKWFFAAEDTARKTLAGMSEPRASGVRGLEDQLNGLAAQHAAKRAGLNVLAQDAQILALRDRMRQISDAARLTQMRIDEEAEEMRVTSPSTSYSAGGATLASSSGNPAAHDRASERWRLLHRRLADLDAERARCVEEIDRRAAALGL